ncbi:hypothetical protein NC652_036473 [Populus alba x Populus x berolinensis]|nr:hypothetical protein NC652_036473 [Populus alba x Populus x berolinensis]
MPGNLLQIWAFGSQNAQLSPGKCLMEKDNKKGSSDNATTPESKEVLMEKGYIISACPIRPEWKQGTAYHTSTAFNHMTNIVPLSNVRNYDGSLKINNTDGSSSSLTYVFVSLDLSTNLICVGQLVDNNYNVHFLFSGCVVHDQVLGRTTAKGLKVGRLFPLHISPSTIIPSFPLLSFACNVGGSGTKMWHKHLGHPNSDVYFLRAKTKVFSIFKYFLALLKTQFSISIKVLRFDSGGEYISNEFNDFLQTHLVALGNKEKFKVDYEDIFAPVAKMTTEEIYMKLPSGMATSPPHDVSQFMSSPRHLHLVVVRRIICYLRGSPTCELFFPIDSSLQLATYSG